MIATRARIERMRLSSRTPADPEEQAEPAKKKLTDVRVNPKIAASLGLKVAAPKAPGAAGRSSAPVAEASSSAFDLLGGLDDPEPQPTPAQRPDAFDAFGLSEAPAPAAPAALDLFALDATAAAPPAPAFDPFATVGGGMPMPQPSGAAPAPAAGRHQPTTSGDGDMFSALTVGITRPLQPMGRGGGLNRTAAGSPGAAAAAAAPALDFFADPGAAGGPPLSAPPAKADPFADLLK